MSLECTSYIRTPV